MQSSNDYSQHQRPQARNADQLEAEVFTEYSQKTDGMRSRGEYVLVLGHSASGKSTTARAAAQLLHHQYVYDSALLVNRRFGYYTERLFRYGDAAAFLPYEVEALLVRFLQNRNTGASSLCDQGIQSIWAYARAVHARGGLDDCAYQTIYALHLTLQALSKTPRLVVQFRCEPSEARRRVELRGREHELASLSTDFIADLDRAYDHVVRSFSSDIPVREIDTTALSPSEALDHFLAILDAPSSR